MRFHPQNHLDILQQIGINVYKDQITRSSTITLNDDNHPNPLSFRFSYVDGIRLNRKKQVSAINTSSLQEKEIRHQIITVLRLYPLNYRMSVHHVLMATVEITFSTKPHLAYDWQSRFQMPSGCGFG